jgi:hypothetical protein
MDMDALLTRRAVPIVAVLLAVLVCPNLAGAQAVTGTLLGTISDQAGLPMPGAMVTITETRTNISFNTTTNDAGFYTFPSLKDGTYQVVAELSGFKKVVRDGIIVPVNTTIRVDLRMELGTLEESITESDPPDRSHRHRASPRVQDRHRHAAHVQPQLPERADSGAGHDAAAPRALGVLQLAGLTRG